MPILTTKKFNFSLYNSLLLLPMMFLTNNLSYAKNSEYIYCANDNYDWKWLKNENGYVKVKGTTKKIETIYYNDKILSIIEGKNKKHGEMEYFSLEGGDAAKDIKEFQQQCVKNFGKEFKYVQVANHFLAGWKPISVDNGMTIEAGIYDIYVITTSYKGMKVLHFFDRLIGVNIYKKPASQIMNEALSMPTSDFYRQPKPSSLSGSVAEIN